MWVYGDAPRALAVALTWRCTQEIFHSPQCCLLRIRRTAVGAHRWYEGVGRLTVHCCTSHLVTRGCEPALTTTVAALSHTHPQSRPTLRTAGSLQGVPPSCCGRRAAVWSGVCSDRPSRFGEASTTCKQPANLAVEAAEWSLSILPDYTPTVRPRPSAVDHLARDMLNPTSDLLSHCHRRVYGARCALAER
jgi:hypothetical protein